MTRLALTSVMALLLSLGWGCSAKEQGRPTLSGLSSDCNTGDSGSAVDSEASEATDSVVNESGHVDGADCLESPPEGQPTSGTISLPLVDPFTDDEALGFMEESCGGCHNDSSGFVKSFWSFQLGQLSKDFLRTDTKSPLAYQTMLLKAKGINAKPKGMPDGPLTPERKEGLLRTLKWFDKQLPVVVAAAAQQHGGGLKDAGEGTGVILNFQCAKPVSRRQFLTRITQDNFDRNPSTAELALFKADINGLVSLEDRSAVVDRIFADPDWRRQFLQIGLKKFAQKIAGVAEIEPFQDQISQVQADDLKEEFYQFIKLNFSELSWKDMLLSSKVQVSTNTAALYEGCSAPQPGEWKSCEMTAPRGSFFSTIGYLRSKQGSFLLPGNNYGRASLMHYIIFWRRSKTCYQRLSGG